MVRTQIQLPELETFALVQNRLGMKALKVFQEDILPVIRVE